MEKHGWKWLMFLYTVLLAFMFTGCADTADNDGTSSNSYTQYTITFNGNGGSIGASSNTQIVSMEKNNWPLRSAADLSLSRYGYTFTGWKSASDSEIILYKDGEELNFSTDLNNTAKYSFCKDLMFNSSATLYAAWEETIYTITFDANGGTIVTSEQGVGESRTAKLKSAEDLGLSRLGYTFVGWALSPDAEEAAYANQAKVSFGSNVTLYALWKENPKRTVTFDANGGNIATASQTVVEQVPTPLSSASALGLAREGYIFAGWGNAATDTSVAYTDEQEVNLPENSEDITLYAIWAQKKTYTITFDPNGGSIGGTSTTFKNTQVLEDETITGELSATLKTKAALILSRTGHAFNGWAESTDGEVVYTDGQEITISGDIILYAVWEETRAYTITYKNGTTTQSTQTETVRISGEEVTLKKASAMYLSKTGYVFLGWAKTATADSAAFKDGATMTLSGDVTLYAVWYYPTYTVTFISDNTRTSRYVDGYGTSYTLPTASSLGLSKTGYTFLGWKTSSSSTTYYATGTSLSITKDTTLYAVWQENCFYVQVYHPGYTASSGMKYHTVGFGVAQSNATISTVYLAGQLRNGMFKSDYEKIPYTGSLAWATVYSYQKNGSQTTVSKSGYFNFTRGGYYRIDITTGDITKMN